MGTYKDEDGSDDTLCKPCLLERLPQRANFTYVRGWCSIVYLLLYVTLVVLLICLPLQLKKIVLELTETTNYCICVMF